MKKLITLFIAVIMVVSSAALVSAEESPVAPVQFSVEVFNDIDGVKTSVKVLPVKEGDTVELTVDGSIDGFQTWDIGSATLVSGKLTDTTITIRPIEDTKVYAVFKTDAKVLEDDDTSVTVVVPKDVLPESVTDINSLVLKVEELKSGADYTAVGTALKDVATKYVPYDISLLYNGVEIQPRGKVTVKLPIPSDMDASKVAVYYVNGTDKELIAHTVSDNFAVIETDHFNYYVLAEKTAVTDGGDDNKAPQTGTAAASLGVVMMLAAVGFVAASKKSK